MNDRKKTTLTTLKCITFVNQWTQNVIMIQRSRNEFCLAIFYFLTQGWRDGRSVLHCYKKSAQITRQLTLCSKSGKIYIYVACREMWPL